MVGGTAHPGVPPTARSVEVQRPRAEERVVTEPEEEREKTAKTDQVLFSPDGDPHHDPAQAPQPDEHLPSLFSHDGETYMVDDEQ
ncbi:hypothetical protein D0Q02_16325 [Micromonospora craniellae]|uniref:Uncharacterized protein n=1 Tax=Micromonospora craniellae TaxID=2294034 RepID=A0A372FXD4_9ACTN|nr:hypothetical protein D0Q02_16325 [Micromonospora craniellae]